MSKTVALVGRPNVGKSTLFNRLTRTRNAIVGSQPGLTRDRHYGIVKTQQSKFIVVDTGGLEFDKDLTRGVFGEMAKQAAQAVDESDLTLFIVDLRAGLTNEDLRIAEQLRKSGRPLWVIANKGEGARSSLALAEFYELGLGAPRIISAAHGDGISDLISEIEVEFQSDLEEGVLVEERLEDRHPVMAIIGRPNVGKSTLVNSILGEERVIVFDQPGTTRDAIEIEFQREGKDYTIIDTAGVRKRGKVNEVIEKFSVIKALQAMEEANVVVLVIDGTEGVSDQDVSLAAFAVEAGRAMVVVINKWDLCGEEAREVIDRTYRHKLRFLDFAKVHRISATKGFGIDGLLRSVEKAFESSRMNLPTPQLTRVLKTATERQSPPRKGYNRPKLRYAHQGGINPPLVVIHGNSIEGVPESYRRYLESSFTTAFKLQGAQVRVIFKQGDNPFSKRSKL
ncbi:MAG: ribosome biogenesis GTPase Der [Burkholderiales bacterium]|nr:ribosome biogenesis GTPase Der [Burkholderiales bacterium]